MSYGVNPEDYRRSAAQFFKLFDSPDFDFIDAEVLLKTETLYLYIKKHQFEQHKYFFICGYHNEEVEDEVAFKEDLKKLQENVKNLFQIF